MTATAAKRRPGFRRSDRMDVSSIGAWPVRERGDLSKRAGFAVEEIMTNPRTVIVLAMHGVPPSDFPRQELGEFFALHARFEHATADESPGHARYQELETKLRCWQRTEENDPYHAASLELARELSRAASCEVEVGFNEFCAPSMDDALDRAAGSGAERVVVVTPMMTPGGEHSEKDIPEAVERARARHPAVEFTYAWPFPVTDVAGFLAAQVARCLGGRLPGRA